MGDFSVLCPPAEPLQAIAVIAYAIAKVLHDLQHDVSAAEEHQPEAVGADGVEPHVEAETRAIESGCTIGLLRCDHNMVQAEYSHRRRRSLRRVALSRNTRAALSRSRFDRSRMSELLPRGPTLSNVDKPRRPSRRAMRAGSSTSKRRRPSPSNPAHWRNHCLALQTRRMRATRNRSQTSAGPLGR